jgi:hypothetical protein
MKNTKKIIIGVIALVLIVVLALFIFHSKKEPAQQQKTLDTVIINNLATSTIDDNLFSSFMCPEDYKTEMERIYALGDFFGTYQKANPNATDEDIQIYRYKFLVFHSCDQTLKNMQHDVMPDTSPMIRFVGKDFGPEFTQFDANSKLWTAYYTQGNQTVDEGLIISFYLKNIWSDKIITAKNVADFFVKSGDAKILNKFETPDTANNGTDYFIVSDEIYPELNIAYVSLTKISQVQDGVVSITYSRKMPDDKANLDKNVNDWLTQDLKLKDGATMEMNNIMVDPTWIDYLSKQKVTLQESSQNSFKCPGSYATGDEYMAALNKFTKQEVSNNPSITIRGIFEDRYAFLVLKNCTEDLKNLQDKLPPGSGTTTEDIIQNEMDEYNSGSYTPASTDTSTPATGTDDTTTPQAITLNFLTQRCPYNSSILFCAAFS